MSMLTWIKSLFARWLKKSDGESSPRRHTATRRPKEHTGAHYYLSDLLDNIDRAFKDFRAFKTADKEAYSLYRHLGAAVFSNDVLLGREGWGYLDVDNLPSFFCAHISHPKASEEKINASFRYMMKIDKPVNVQPTNGTVYRVGGVYSDGERLHVASVFHVSVAGDGTVVPLKEICVRSERPAFKKRNRFDCGPVIRRATWDYPNMLRDIASDNDKTIEKVARDWFYITAEASLTQNAGITVRVRKGADVANFAIDMLRTPYFFADREKTVNEKGRTKRILHIVKAHYRTGAGGSKKLVKSHFRGLRKFTWNGYKVSIGLNGWHHGGNGFPSGCS